MTVGNWAIQMKEPQMYLVDKRWRRQLPLQLVQGETADLEHFNIEKSLKGNALKEWRNFG